MKLFKITALLFSVFSIFIFVTTNNRPPESFNHVANQSDFYQKLNLALKTSHLETSSIDVRDFHHQVEFYVQSSSQPIRVILSSQKDPFWQISSLQELLKTAKMNQQQLMLVDLSPVKPYVTFKNN